MAEKTDKRRKRSERGDQMARMVAGGATFEQVGERFGCSASNVFTICKRRGVKSVRARS